MQRYGQTIAVTVEDLTRSDDGKAIMSMNNYRNLVRRKQVNILRPGKGLGSCALIEYSSLPGGSADGSSPSTAIRRCC